MPLQFVAGDPLKTRCDMLLIGHNARGRTELDALSMHMMRQYPAAYATYTRRARRGRQPAGDVFFWTQARPKLLFATVRDSSVGATRLRYVQKILIIIARDYKLYNMRNIALTPLGNQYERDEIKKLIATWLGKIALPVIVYEEYVPDKVADEYLP